MRVLYARSALAVWAWLGSAGARTFVCVLSGGVHGRSPHGWLLGGWGAVSAARSPVESLRGVAVAGEVGGE